MSDTVNKYYGGRTRIRSCGICIKNNALLLVQHKGLGKEGHLWVPPGGGVEFMEDAQEALIREFKEETNLDITVGKFLFVNEILVKPLHAIELFFEVEITEGKLETGADPEHKKADQIIEEVKFVTFEEISLMDNEVLHNALHNIENLPSILNMAGYFKFSG